MKTLLILRHAKSSWDDPNMSDFDRPLNERGLKTAPLMGQLIVRERLLPDAILSSPACRAIKTAELIARSSDLKDKITTVEHFYPGSPFDHLETLARSSNELNSIMIIGHNPGLEELVYTLTGQPERLPTAALAHLELPIHAWSELSSKTKAKLIRVYRPKEIFT